MSRENMFMAQEREDWVTPEGQEIIRLYYEWSPVISKLIEDDENTKMEIKELIDVLLLMFEVR